MSFGDRLTDRLARRPAGWLGRKLYRRAIAHQPGFDLALRQVPLRPEDHVLDVGCGGGAFLARVLAAGCRAAGIDHSPDMIATTREQNAAAIEGGRLDLQEGDAAALPFADGAFSHAFCLHAFFFFPDPAKAIAEMARVLRPGGHLTILTMAPDMARRMRWLFGPIGARMRLDAPERMAEWCRAAGLHIQSTIPTRDGGYLLLARRLPPVGMKIEMLGFSGRILGLVDRFAVIEADIAGDVPAHRAVGEECAYVLSGEIAVEVNGIARSMSAGGHVVIPAGALHSARARSPARILLFGPSYD
ncbi:methyltransferase domain-containing protein [Dongia sp.]|uniref:methyltransferase domain-containing protein n=1 Tax=Dongia sp. TaxID=1977262 RepID=UPI0035B4CF85